ncbi:hypothetical protein [Pseudomonas sp. UMAB-08]|uniref:hypothetical protein n=1 Tax=Pseudomonas sp. UMAB-08 TaxID=1365375 RepID=UPI001C5A576B|nr:hypothetical protein [Pseudomonas sp. UMAB-08]
MLKDIKQSYVGTWKLWASYWRVYGGLRAVLTSLYFGVSILVCALSYRIWSESGWWDLVISAVPTMLGFTLAGLAVFLGMDSKFSAAIAGGTDKEPSPFIQMIAAFVHFVVVQVVALLYAFLAKASFFSVDGLPAWYYDVMPYGRGAAWFIGFGIFIYAVMSMLAATFSIFRTSRWFDAFVGPPDSS